MLREISDYFCLSSCKFVSIRLATHQKSASGATFHYFNVIHNPPLNLSRCYFSHFRLR